MSPTFINFYYSIFYLYSYIGLLYFFFPSTEKFSSYILLLQDLGLIFPGLYFLNYQVNNYIRRFIVVFFVFSIFTLAVNITNVSFLNYLNGLREYLILFSSLLFVNAALSSKYGKYFFDKFFQFCKIFLVFQIPVSIYQFIIHGLSDWVGGTFGPGYSGVLTTSIFMICFLLVWKRSYERNSDRFDFKFNIRLLPFFLPVLINETKITFIFLFLFFIFQMRLKQKAIIANIGILLFAILVYNLYENYSASGLSADLIFEKRFISDYLFGEYVEGDTDIPRFTKLYIAAKLLSNDFLKLLFGNGIGIFKGKKFLKGSEFTKKYEWLLEGSRPYLFFLLMQGGIANTFIILMLFYYPVKKLKFFHVNSHNFNQNLNRLKYFFVCTFIIILFYNDSLRFGAFVNIVSFISMIFINQKQIVFSLNREK